MDFFRKKKNKKVRKPSGSEATRSIRPATAPSVRYSVTAESPTIETSATEGPITEASQPCPRGSEVRKEADQTGIEILHDPSDAFVDICFVHGLTGGRSSTWTARGQTSPWPKSLLAPMLRGARLMTWGYDAYFVRLGPAGTNSLDEHASDLVADLADERIECRDRRLILVAHSLGGLVCKRALLFAQHAEHHLQEVHTSLTGIMFLGTPHQGSWMADWSDIPARLLGIVKSTNLSLLQILQADDKFLRSIQTDFLNMLKDRLIKGRKIELVCFYEELPMPVVGVIVSQDSAKLPGYNARSIHANHRDMVKFASPQDPGFRRVLKQLERWAKECSKSVQKTGIEVQMAVDEILSATVDPSALSKCMRNFLQVTAEDFSDTAIRRLSISMGITERLCNLSRHETALRYLQDLGKQQSKNHDVIMMDVEDETKSLRTDIHNLIASKKRRCLESLTYDDMKHREFTIRSPMHDTCIWIYQHQAYKWWTTKRNRLLWVKGKPGSGKSVLMKSLSTKQKLETGGDRQDGCGSIVLDFYFTAGGSTLERSPKGLYSSLIHGLVQEDKNSMIRFLDVFLEKENSSSSSGCVWGWRDLAEIFHQKIIMQLSKPISILIDALDECDEDMVRQVISMFQRSLEQAVARRRTMRVCWSSRYYPNISASSSLSRDLHLGQHNRPDIGVYLQKGLGEIADPKMVRLGQEILARSDGVFLWVVLATYELRKAFDKGVALANLQTFLEDLPEELDLLFDRIVGRIRWSACSRTEFQTLAMLLLCSCRPLTVEEFFVLQTMCSKDVPFFINGSELSTDTYTAFMQPFTKRINDVSGGLFEVVRPEAASSLSRSAYVRRSSHARAPWEPCWTLFQDPWTVDVYKRHANTPWQLRVQVIHESVRQYLLGPKGVALLRAASLDDFIGHGTRYISKTCLRGLLATNCWPTDTVSNWTAELPLNHIVPSMAFNEPLTAPPITFVQSFLSTYFLEHMEMVSTIYGRAHQHCKLAGGLREQRLAMCNVIRAHLASKTSRITDRLLGCYSLATDELSEFARIMHYFKASLQLFDHMGIETAQAGSLLQTPGFVSSFLAVYGLHAARRPTSQVGDCQCSKYGLFLAGKSSIPPDDHAFKVHCVIRFDVRTLSDPKSQKWVHLRRASERKSEPTLIGLQIMRPDQLVWSSELGERWSCMPCKAWSRSIPHNRQGLYGSTIVFRTENPRDQNAPVGSLVLQKHICTYLGDNAGRWWEDWISSYHLMPRSVVERQIEKRRIIHERQTEIYGQGPRTYWEFDRLDNFSTTESTVNRPQD